MSTRAFPHTLNPARPPQLGVVVLQADETLEPDLRRLIGAEAEVLVTRIPSGTEVTPDTLAAMEAHLAGAAALLPAGARFSALAYACTSGAAQIGPEGVADILRDTTGVARVNITGLVIKERGGTYDAMNFYPTAKAVVDGLIDYGLCVDDSNEYVQGPFLDPGGKGPAALVLTIKELPDTPGKTS